MRRLLHAVAFRFPLLPLFLTAAVLAPSGAMAALHARCDAQAITVDEATPNGTVTVIGAGLAPSNPVARMVHQEIVEVPLDGAGHAQIAVDSIPAASVWLVVDVRTGAYVVATPDGYTPRVREVPGGALSADALQDPSPSFDMWIVRPGGGAWRRSAARGRDTDESPAGSSQVKVNVARFGSISQSPASPGRLKPGDVVLRLDYGWMEYWVATVTAKHVTGGGTDAQ